jgi:hypothetical protein
VQSDIRELIESELSHAIEAGLAEEEALAEAAGLIAEAETCFSRLSTAEPSPSRTTRKRRKRC